MDLVELQKFIINNWIKPHTPNEYDLLVAIEEYKRCTKLNTQEYARWVKYENR